MTTNWMMILVKKVFTFFSPKSSVCHARLRAGLFIQETAYGGLSYKVKKEQHFHTVPLKDYPTIFSTALSRYSFSTAWKAPLSAASAYSGLIGILPSTSVPSSATISSI